MKSCSHALTEPHFLTRGMATHGRILTCVCCNNSYTQKKKLTYVKYRYAIYVRMYFSALCKPLHL